MKALSRPIALVAVSAILVVVHAVLVRAMAHGHVAHVLLGSGNGSPPVGAALLAIALVLVRLVTILGVPGLLFAAAADVVAFVLVGPPKRDDQGTVSRGGAGSSPEIADDATGTIIGARGTE